SNGTGKGNKISCSNLAERGIFQEFLLGWQQASSFCSETFQSGFASPLAGFLPASSDDHRPLTACPAGLQSVTTSFHKDQVSSPDFPLVSIRGHRTTTCFSWNQLH